MEHFTTVAVTHQLFGGTTIPGGNTGLQSRKRVCVCVYGTHPDNNPDATLNNPTNTALDSVYS